MSELEDMFQEGGVAKTTQSGGAFSGFVIGALKVVLVIVFVLLCLGGLVYGAMAADQASYDSRALYIPVGGLLGLGIGFLYAVLVTGFGFVLLDIRRLLKKQNGE